MRHLPRFGLPDLSSAVDPGDAVRRPPHRSDGALTGAARARLGRLWARH